MKNQTRDIPALSMRAAFEPASVNTDARTVDITWTTGARVLRTPWFDDPYFEELSLDPAHVRMGRLSSGRAPFLADHNSRTVDAAMGVIQSARIDGGKGVATVRFPKEGIDPEADKLFAKIRDGIVGNVSVGYRIFKMQRIEDGTTTTPVFRAVDWEPHEVSAVAIGADAEAAVRSAELAQRNACEFVETRGMPPQEEKQKMDETQKAAAEQKAAEEKRAADLKAAADAARGEAAQAERERITGIQHAVRVAKLGDEFAQRMVAEGKSLDQVRALVLDELAKRSEQAPIEGHVRVQVGEEDREKWIRGAAAGMLSRSGRMHDVVIALDDHRKKDSRHQNPDLLRAFESFDPKDNGGEFRAFTLVDVARDSLERRGVRTRGMSADKIVERALYARDNGGQQTASDFSVALENVMYKTLLGAYAQQADSWRRFCGVDSTQDFRPSNRYRLGSFGVLDQLDESGEYKQKQIPDAIKQQITTQTYGNKIALSRKAIVNDDMGAVVASAERFGRMAGLSIEVAVYNLLAQNSGLGPSVTYNGITAPLFDAQFANIGTQAALSSDAIDADRVTMGSQVDISNNEKLDIRPSVLLVPLTLGAKAKQINRAAYDPTAGAAFEAPNKVAGLFRDIVDTPRLSGTRRYMFSDQTPALVVVFLNGTQVPFMDQRLGWDIDGIEWKLRLDFNAQGFDPKGALTNAG